MLRHLAKANCVESADGLTRPSASPIAGPRRAKNPWLFSMKIIGPEEVHAALSYPALIDALQETFSGEFTMPPRNVFLLDENPDTHDAFAVLPSWNTSLIGVKAFTYFPSNAEPYKSLYSKILLFDRAHGEPLALVDGTTVEGIDGLRDYLLKDRHDDVLQQFCRKLLGYALGRVVQLSDRPLLGRMQSTLETNGYRFGLAVEAIVTSRQFREIRGQATTEED